MAVLYGMLNAFGAAPPFAIVVVAYFIGQVANTVPVPGAASGGLVGVLLAFGVTADLAIVAVLAYRAVAIWIPAPIGLVALGKLRRTMARWDARGRRRGRRASSRPVPADEPSSSQVRAAATSCGPPPWRPLRSPRRGMTRRPPAALLAVAFVAALGFALTTAGVIPLPDLEAALTDLADTLGTWTYALVGGARLPRDRRLRRPHRAGRDRRRARRRGRRAGRGRARR